MRRALLFAFALFALPAVNAADLQPFSASYTADWKQLPMSGGSASRSLEKNANGTWTLNFKASMMIASLTEVSTLKVDKDQLLPQTYHFERGGLGKSKTVDLVFDWPTKFITGSDRGDAVKIPLNAGVLDKSTYQLALQHDVAAGKKSMSYQVVDGDEIDTYDFRVLGTEKVETKVGSVDGIKVERVRDPTQNKRITVMWFAKDYDYLLVSRLKAVNTRHRRAHYEKPASMAGFFLAPRDTWAYMKDSSWPSTGCDKASHALRIQAFSALLRIR
jgi:hypothetical protein